MESTGLTSVRAGTSKAAEPEKGPAALLFFNNTVFVNTVLVAANR